VRVRDRSRVEREIEARAVVAADGRDSQVARMAGVKARILPHGRFGYYAYYRNMPLVSGDRTLFWFTDPDIAYAFPQDDGLTLLATFQTKDRLPWFKRDIERNFESYFEGLPNAPDIAKAERTSKVMGRLDLPNKMRPAGVPGLAFVGDAAMAADPVWGVGCGFALQSGEWLAEELGGALRDGSEPAFDAAIDRYRRRHRRELLGHFLLTSDYATGRRFNPLETLLFKAGAKDPQVALGFHALGSRSVRPNDPAFTRTIARGLRVSLRGRDGAELQPLEPAARPPLGFAAPGAGEAQRQRDVLEAGQLGHELAELEHEAELRAAQRAARGVGERGELGAAVDDAAGVDRHDPGEAVQQR
jgi:hypothetical protein